MKRTLAVAAVALALSAPGFGQGCSMCARSAGGSGETQKAALRKGVVVLGLPPLMLMIGFGTLAWRYRSKNDLAAVEESVKPQA